MKMPNHHSEGRRPRHGVADGSKRGRWYGSAVGISVGRVGSFLVQLFCLPPSPTTYPLRSGCCLVFTNMPMNDYQAKPNRNAVLRCRLAPDGSDNRSTFPPNILCCVPTWGATVPKLLGGRRCTGATLRGEDTKILRRLFAFITSLAGLIK